MPVYSPTSTRQMTPSTDETDGRRGSIPRQFSFTPTKGIPRFEDLLSLRVLERSPTISLPLNTVRNQVTTPSWGIRPTVENSTTAHNMAADEIKEFLDGNFNPNGQKFSNLLKLFVTDILSPDTGTLECVPTASADADGNYWLRELWHLDGITMSKELDEHGQIPDPPEPAYYQFAPKSALPYDTWDDVVDRIGSKRSRSVLFAYGRRQHKPIEFQRDQVVWLERNPQSATNYGFGKVQQCRYWAEILLNVDLSNSRYFSENEVPQGILSIVSGSQTELDRNRAYFQDTIKGQTDHIIPMFDAAPDEIDWTPIQGTPEELQFLDSQQWYHKLVWFLFGLNQGEIGDFESGNRSMGEYHGRQVFRQTTKPLLDDIVETFNQQILPKMEAYWRVDGELEFFVDVEHEQMQELERQRQKEDLQNNLTTPNSIRRDRGEDEVPWGDVPPEVIQSMARKHPEWAMEHWGGVDPEELPSPGLGTDLDLFSGHGHSNESSQEHVDATPRDRESPNNVDDEMDGETLGNLDAGGWERRDEGEIGDEFPGVAALIDSLTSEAGRVIETELEDVEEIVEDQWPDEVDGTPVIDVDGIVNALQLQDVLMDPVVDANAAAMQESADQEADRLEEELEERYALVPEVAEVSLDFDLTGTFAFEAMRRRAARNMVSVEDTVRERIRNVLLEVVEDGVDGDRGVGAATQRLREEIPEISSNHPRLIARTELPQASREGTQALGEATDVVGGKQWLSSNDSVSRPWHDAMHEEIVGVNDSWTVPSGWQGAPDYQPDDYPRTAHVVGEDQPFNCRCLHRNVLEEDLPDDVRSLSEVRGVDVELHVSDRQFEIWREHAEPGETVADLLDRVASAHSARQAYKALGVSSATWYDWVDHFDVDV